MKYSTSCEEQLNDWQTKSLTIARAMQEKVKTQAPEREIRPNILKRLCERGYLSPLSNEGFVRYWQPNWHCYAKPGLRPCSILKGITKYRRDRFQTRNDKSVECKETVLVSQKRRSYFTVGEINAGMGTQIPGESPATFKTLSDRSDEWSARNSFSEHWGELVPFRWADW